MPSLTRSEAERLLAGLQTKRDTAIDDGDLDEVQRIDTRVRQLEGALAGEVVRLPRADHLPARQEHRAASEKSKVVAGVLAILLGVFGVHKFYLSKPVQGLLYLLFFWTGIPAIAGFIEGILYLVSTDEAFAEKYGPKE
ncbi:MAG: hypothetical protein Rubg2KO_05320 [Rubricoccaceae bacterium]